MLKDAYGLAISTDSPEAAAAWDDTVDHYLRNRFATGRRLKAVLAADPGFGLAHVLQGYLFLLALNQAMVPAARDALARAMPLLARAAPREQAHAAALAAWAEGDLHRAQAIWHGLFTQDAGEVLAFRLHHFLSFWLGEAGTMLAAVEGLLPRWDRAAPHTASILACRAFAQEESGHYLLAEAAGREAIARDPGEVWAAHAVAHVLEMQGRRAEGIAWLAGLEPHWEGANNLAHHLWWHRAMYHMERREFDQVLALYDSRFRNLESPLTQAMPDLYIDVQNAASMLFRLARQGVAVGGRWQELADKAEARIGDTCSAFTLPHWMMALCGDGRFAAAERMLEAMRDASQANQGTIPPLLARYAVPVSEAVLRHARGDHAGAVAVMRPALGGMYRLGGSHAQQDVLEQLFLDAAVKAGLEEDTRLLLERVAGRHPVPPQRRLGYAEAAAALPF